MGKRDRTHEMSWMEKVRKRLRDEITSVKEFSIAVETLEKEKEISIQNLWWKKLKPARRKLKRASEQAKNNNDLMPVW